MIRQIILLVYSWMKKNDWSLTILKYFQSCVRRFYLWKWFIAYNFGKEDGTESNE